MNFLSNAKCFVKTASGKLGRKVSAKSPEILIGLGVVSFVGTVVLACNVTAKKTEEIKEKHKRTLADIDNSLEIANEESDTVEVSEDGSVVEKSYTIEEAKKDRFTAYLETGVSYARVYAPAVLLGAFSVTCFAASYGIMKKRTVAISALYSATEKAFNEYRERVRKELGKEKDEEFRYGYKRVKKADATYMNDGEEVSKKEDIDTVPWDESDKKEYGTTFEFAPWTTFKYAENDILDSTTLSVSRENMQYKYDQQGYIFLNDILEDLGIKKVPYGQIVGLKKGIGDSYVDYRIKRVFHELSPNDKIYNPKGLKYQITYILDINTCGIIWDKI